jgi:hypothetical protein
MSPKKPPTSDTGKHDVASLSFGEAVRVPFDDRSPHTWFVHWARTALTTPTDAGGTRVVGSPDTGAREPQPDTVSASDEAR